MDCRNRIERLARGIETLEPDVDVVHEAMAEFRRIGRLPRDTKTACAVIKWAETGEPPASGDGGSLLERLCLTIGQPKPPPPPRDAVMHGLYEDAISSDDVERLLARAMLACFAKAGFDPSKPQWVLLGWDAPKMTSNSMALTLVGFPGSFVRPQHRRRTEALAEKLRAFMDQHAWNERRHDAFVAASEAFFETGRLPSNAAEAEAILWSAELGAHCLPWWTGGDDTRLIEALRAYWRAPATGRAAALDEVRAAVRAGPRPAAGKHPDLWTRLKPLLLPFIRKVMDAEEQLA